MDKSELILDFIKAKGPSLPVAIGKEIKEDSIVAGAYLSTLMGRKLIKVSYLKVGGSPLYYLPGQEARLQEFSDKLNRVDRGTYELLAEKKVLRESELEPLQRVSLKQLRDFAIPLNVKMDNSMEVFWKWYLLPDDETERRVKKILHIEEPAAKTEPVVPAAPVAPIPVPKPIEKLAAAEKPVERQAEIPRRVVPETHHPKPAPIPVVAEENERKEDVPRATQIPASRPVETVRESQRVLVKESDLNDRFYTELKEYFQRNRIEILESSIIKKGSEIDLLIAVPSAVGKLTYYCKAKAKKRSNEGDLAAAFVQGQAKKLPIIYLTKGELTKRALDMLSHEFKGLIYKKF